MYKSSLLIEQKFQLYLNLRGRPWQLKAVGLNLVWSKGRLESSCLEAWGCACLLPGSVWGAAHSVLGDFLVSVSAEKCSLEEMMLVSDIHMQGCHILVFLQRLVLLLTSCWRLACVSWGKSGHLALKIAEDNWLLRSLQAVCGLRGNKSVCELLVSQSNMWPSSVVHVLLAQSFDSFPRSPQVQPLSNSGRI